MLVDSATTVLLSEADKFNKSCTFLKRLLLNILESYMEWRWCCFHLRSSHSGLLEFLKRAICIFDVGVSSNGMVCTPLFKKEK